MPTPPSNTPEERQRALELALEARETRAALKQHVHDAKLHLSDLLEEGARGRTDEVGEGARIAGRITAEDAVTAVWGMGVIRAAAVFQATGIDPQTHLDELSEADREALIDAVNQYADAG